MHRHAATGPVVLAVLVATLFLLSVPSAPAGPALTTPTVLSAQQPGTATEHTAPVVHDEATVYRNTVGAVHLVPSAVVAEGQRAASPQLIGAEAGPSQAGEPGSEAIITVQGRAPPAAAR
ncbi:MAG: hypothetical protein ACRDTE_15405 [Pseudonocardiaceae bacterium]